MNIRGPLTPKSIPCGADADYLAKYPN